MRRARCVYTYKEMRYTLQYYIYHHNLKWMSKADRFPRQQRYPAIHPTFALNTHFSLIHSFFCASSIFLTKVSTSSPSSLLIILPPITSTFSSLPPLHSNSRKKLSKYSTAVRKEKNQYWRRCCCRERENSHIFFGRKEKWGASAVVIEPKQHHNFPLLAICPSTHNGKSIGSEASLRREARGRGEKNGTFLNAKNTKVVWLFLIFSIIRSASIYAILLSNKQAVSSPLFQ